MIYYSIQHHGNQHSNLHWLVKSLLKLKGVVLDISLDSSVEDYGIFSKSLDFINDKSLVHRSAPVIWGGASVVNQMRESLRRAINSDSSWEYWINLSGSCVPLINPVEIFSYLKNIKANSGKDSFVFKFTPNNYQLSPLLNDYVNCDSCNNNVELYSRINASLDDDVYRLFTSGEFDPARNVIQRFSFFCADSFTNNEKKLHIRSLTRSESDARNEFVRQNGLNFGRQWVVLHRDLVEKFFACDAESDIYNMTSSLFIPDESYFQYLSSAFPDFFSRIDFRNNLRLNNGAPSNLDIDQVKSVYGNFLFGRKLGTEAELVHDYLGDKFNL